EGVLEERDPKRVRILADLTRPLVERREQGADLLDCVGVGDVAVGEAPRPPDGAFRVPTEVDGRPAGTGRRRGHLDPVVPVPPALERESPARPRASKDLDRLRRPGEPLRPGHAEHAELLLAPSDAESEDQPAL